MDKYIWRSTAGLGEMRLQKDVLLCVWNHYAWHDVLVCVHKCKNSGNRVGRGDVRQGLWVLTSLPRGDMVVRVWGSRQGEKCESGTFRVLFWAVRLQE